MFPTSIASNIVESPTCLLERANSAGEDYVKFSIVSCDTQKSASIKPGRFGWDGGYGTSWYSDPNAQLTGILLTQRVMDSPTPPAVFSDFWTTLGEIAAK